MYMYRLLIQALARSTLLLVILLGVTAHAAQGSEGGDSAASGGQKFSIAVIPDTQYLLDEDRYDPQVLAKTLQWIVDHTQEKNIVFTVQLGDIVNNGLPTEFAKASDVFKILDSNDIQYGYAAGNHDINGNLYDNVRGPSPYLDYMHLTNYQEGRCRRVASRLISSRKRLVGRNRVVSVTRPRSNEAFRGQSRALEQPLCNGLFSDKRRRCEGCAGWQLEARVGIQLATYVDCT
jgi:Calcineurin-like phosphoesterase